VSCQDWRDASPDEVAPLYAAERHRWLAELAWDPADLFDIVERGRLAGHVAGWISFDQDDRAVGWTFYILHNGLLQIGGLVGERPAVVRRLLDAVLASPEASVARGLSCFVYPNTTGTSSALERQRFSLRESLYLSRPLGPTDVAADGMAAAVTRAWTTADFAGTVRVLAASYAGVPAAECFAPDGTREQWAHYAGQILRTPGCGRFDPVLSRVVCAPGSTIPAAVALATWIAPDAVHVAQIAVAPDRRRQGLARVLMQSVLHASAKAGATQITLMVDRSNVPAVGLYESLGFAERSRMIFGSRAARSRVAA
jgi:ribosomal protein S18 acetylase RimI-like enzyme